MPISSESLWAGILELGYDQPGGYNTAPAVFAELAKLGFVLRSKDGEHSLSAKGRRAFTVAESGDGEVKALDNYGS